MNTGFGQSQPKMHVTKLLESCVGEHPCTIAAFYQAKHCLNSAEESEADRDVEEEEEGGSNPYVALLCQHPVELKGVREMIVLLGGELKLNVEPSILILGSALASVTGLVIDSLILAVN